MTALLTALSSGISAKKILEFLMRKSPELAPKITKILASGITAEKALNFLSKGQNFEKLKASMEQQYPTENNANPLVQAQEIRNKNMGTDLASGLQRAAPGIIGGAAALGTGLALKHALPNQIKSLFPQTQEENPTVSQQPPNAPIPGASVTPNQPAAPIAQPNTNITQPPNIQQPQINAIAPEKDGKRLEALKKFNKKAKKTGILDEEIERFEKEYGPMAPEEKIAIEAEQEPTELKPATIELGEEKKPIAKNETVITPNGVGEVREIRNGKAIVEVGGKKYQINEDELETSPLPEKDLADLHDDLMRGIEKETGEEISRMVDFAGYDPKTNTLAFLPHTGALYTYSDISPEDIELLTDVLSTRKTSGENFIGAWKAGSKSPIGAALSKLIQKLQTEAGGKGKEYSGKFETVYKSREPAILAAKKKKEEKAKREREERKRKKA